MSSHRGRAMVHQVLLGSWGSYRWFWVGPWGVDLRWSSWKLLFEANSPESFADIAISFFQVEAKGRWAFCFILLHNDSRLHRSYFRSITKWLSMSHSHFFIWSTLPLCCRYPYHSEIARWNPQAASDPIKAEQKCQKRKAADLIFLCFWKFGQTRNQIYILYTYYTHNVLVIQVNVIYLYVCYLESFGYIMMIFHMMWILWYDIHASNIMVYERIRRV